MHTPTTTPPQPSGSATGRRPPAFSAACNFRVFLGTVTSCRWRPPQLRLSFLPSAARLYPLNPIVPEAVDWSGWFSADRRGVVAEGTVLQGTRSTRRLDHSSHPARHTSKRDLLHYKYRAFSGRRPLETTLPPTQVIRCIGNESQISV